MSKKRILIAIGCLTVFIASAITILVIANEEKIKLFAIERVSDNLHVELSVEEVEVSVWSGFPNVRVNLNQIVLGGSGNKTVNSLDTLLTAEKLGVSLSLWDVIFSDPVVEAFILEEAHVHLKQGASGDWNTSVFKTQDLGDRSLQEDVKVNLYQLIDVSIVAQTNDNKTFSFEIEHADISGESFEVSFSNGKSIGDGITEELIPLQGSLSGELLLGADQEIELTIRNAEVNGLSLSGKLNYDHTVLAEIQIDEISVNQLKKIFKKDFVEGYLSGIVFDGSASFSIKTDSKNTFVDWKLPESGMALSPNITGFSMVKKGRVSAEGSCEYSSKSQILAVSISTFEIDTKGLQVNGDARCLNTKSADWTLNVQSTLDAGAPYRSWIPEIQSAEYSYLPQDGVLKSSAELRISAWGKLEGFSCTVESDDLHGALNAIPYSIRNMRAHFDNSKIQIKSFGYKWGGNIGEVTAELFGVDKWIDGGSVEGDVDVKATRMNVEAIVQWWEHQNVVDTRPEVSRFLPAGSDISLKIVSEKLTWDALECESFLTRLHLTESKLKITNATTKTLEGEVRVEGSFRPNLEGWSLNLSGTADGLSLPKLFDCYDNFGQSTLRAQHLGGSVSIAGTSKMGWGKEGLWSAKSLNASLNVAISHGSLENFEVFDDVADYLDEHRLIAPLVNPNDLRKRLKTIQLDDVETPIYISSSTTTIPSIHIHSSAMDVRVEGEHSFSGKIDYTLGFALRDLRKSREIEFGNIEDDGLGNMFFLAMDGTLNEPVYSYDRSAHKTHRRDAFRDEAVKIKESILNSGVNIKETKTEEEVKTSADTKGKPKRKKKTKSSNLNEIEDDDF